MRFQVPQFVDIEDKIIGPFTLKQFLMYVVAVMVLIPVYVFSDLSLFLTIALPVVGIAAAFAHVKVNGRSLSTVLFNAFSFYSQGQLYVWQRTTTPKPLRIQDLQWEELAIGRQIAKEELTSLTKMAQIIETSGNTVQSEDIADPLLSTPGNS